MLKAKYALICILVAATATVVAIIYISQRVSRSRHAISGRSPGAAVGCLHPVTAGHNRPVVAST